MTPYAIFPADLTKPCILTGDAGWTLTSHAGQHPANGAPAQVFDLPDSTPEGNGASLTIPGYSAPFHGVLFVHLLPTGPGLLVDVYPKPSSKTLPKLVANGEFLAHE